MAFWHRRHPERVGRWSWEVFFVLLAMAVIAWLVYRNVLVVRPSYNGLP